MSWAACPISAAALANPVPTELVGAQGCSVLYLPVTPAAIPCEVWTDDGVASMQSLPAWTGTTAGDGFPPYAGALTINPGQCIRFAAAVRRVYVRAAPWAGFPCGGIAGIRYPSIASDTNADIAADTLLAGYRANIPFMAGGPGDVVLPGSQDVPSSLRLLTLAGGTGVVTAYTSDQAIAPTLYGPDAVALPGVCRRYRRLRLEVVLVEGAVTLGSLSMNLHTLTLNGRPMYGGSRVINWGSNDANTCRFSVDLGPPSEWLDSVTGFASELGTIQLYINGGTASRTLYASLVLDQGNPTPGAVACRMNVSTSAWPINTHHIAAIPTGTAPNGDGFTQWSVRCDTAGAFSVLRRIYSPMVTVPGAAFGMGQLENGGIAESLMAYGPGNVRAYRESVRASGMFCYLFTATSAVNMTENVILSGGSIL